MGSVELMTQIKTLYQEVLEHEIKSENDSADCESVYSFQGYDTEYVRTDVDCSSDNLDLMEFEPADESFSSTVTDSESDFEDKAEMVEDVSDDSSAFADSEFEQDLSSHFDKICQQLENGSDLNFQKEKWTCLGCKRLNSNPVRFCKKCYEERQECFPERPKRRKRRQSCGRQRIPAVVQEDTPLPIPMTSIPTMPMDTVDGLGGDCGDVVDGPMPKRPRLDDDCPSTSQDSAIDTGTSVPDNVCGICYQRQANAVFVHGRSGHGKNYCYPCAKKMSKCPICNRKVNRVIKLFV